MKVTPYQRLLANTEVQDDDLGMGQHVTLSGTVVGHLSYLK